MMQYSELRLDFLRTHLWCEVGDCKRSSKWVHHKRGRGKWLLDVEYWLAVCFWCHRRIHDNPAWAREQGYLLSRT